MPDVERIVITIHPSPTDDGLLTVADAMRQVLDALKIFEQAAGAMAAPEESFEWRLEKASTNSPFTVTAVASPRNPKVDITAHVRQVKATVRSGLKDLVEDNAPSWWMKPETVTVARDVFARNLNGIWRTDIELAPNETFFVDRKIATDGLQAIEAINAINVGAGLAERVAWGEMQGVMVAAGRYRNKPAIQIRTDIYGFIWCQLPNVLIEKFGNEHTMRDVWEGRTLGVRGRLIYAAGGKLSRIESQEIREIDVPVTDLESVLDADFTAGLDPVEYLRQLHEGRLG